MKKYETPKLEEIKISVEDILFVSLGDDGVIDTEKNLLGLND